MASFNRESVAGSVIQATGTVEFKDGLRMGVSLEDDGAQDQCLCPKSSANPIAVTPIWKWEFGNGKQPIRGL